MTKPMTMRRIFLALATLAVSPAINAQASSKPVAWTPPGPTACSFAGWTTDQKPVIQVRAAAAAQAAVVGTLPTTRDG